MSEVAAPAFTLRAATEDDFEALLALSIQVMRGHLERVGRFDPERRRARMRAGFDPRTMRVIEAEGRLAGCIAVVHEADHVEVHSFYVVPEFQGRGLGAAVLRAALSPHAALPCRIEVLKDSPAARFWERHGFVRVGEQPFDWIYERPQAWAARRHLPDAGRAGSRTRAFTPSRDLL